MQQIAASAGITILLSMTGIVCAQTPASPPPAPTEKMTVPEGYAAHHSIDLGGRMSGLTGSGAMYSTLVNMQSGPRVLGETLDMHALPEKKNPFVDHLKAFGSGFGGDPNIFSKVDAEKGKLYEFSGLFRRDRQYFDYDLLGNPNITTGVSINNMVGGTTTAALAWPQVKQSPVLFNTVRRMTDTNLTLYPLSPFSYRVGYSHNTFEGPSLSPSYTIAKYDALLQQYQRNSTDDFLGAIDWKPVNGTKLSFEEQMTHYKADSFFTLNPNGFMAQEANGTRADLGNWDSETAYGIAACNTTSMGTGYTNSSNYTILSSAQSARGLPVINAACSVVTSYLRTQPTRVLIPTETVRLQSSSLKNLTMNGDVHYTLANMHMPNYYENVLGLSGAVRSITYSGGYAAGHRSVIGADFGVIWQANKIFTLADQASYSSIQQPGYSYIPAASTLSTPSTAGNMTVNYTGKLTPGTQALPHGINGTWTPNYYGQEFIVNNLTASWDATARARFSLTYRYSNRNIGQGAPHGGPIPTTLADPVNGTVAITENGGIFNAVLRPSKDWELNGSVGIFYDDNAFTPVSPRQSQQYRIHTIYRPRRGVTITGAFNDRERHNNTNNNQAVVAAGDDLYEGQIAHSDHSRVISLGTMLAPNEHYSFDFNYAYSDVYTATNICYTSGAASNLPGAATLTASGAPNVCPGVYARGSTTTLVDWFAKDFMDAPTNYVSAALTLIPVDKIHSTIGYRISSVNGSRFFNDARDVNGSLVSTYQSPYLNFAWTMRPGWSWKAEYNFYGYGEGGASGAQYCSYATSMTATVVPCSSITAYPTGMTESSSGLTAPRNFHANNVLLGVHWEF
jgi:hypothetical protein